MTNKATKYGLMTIAAVLLVAMAFAGAGAATTLAGAGTQENPYLIGTVDDLTELMNNQSYWQGNYYFSQTADIVVSDISRVSYDVNTRNATVGNATTLFGNYTLASSVNVALTKNINLNLISWNNHSALTPIGNESMIFSGTYLGNSHYISGILIENINQKGTGIFGWVNGSTTISDLTLKNSIIVGKNCVGGLIGLTSAPSEVNLIRCNMSNVSVIGWMANVAGLIGSGKGNRLYVTDCHGTNVAVAGSNEGIGGLIGECADEIHMTGCTLKKTCVHAPVSTKKYSGGLIAQLSIKETQSVVNGCKITDSYIYSNMGVTGGVVGEIYNASIVGCKVINSTISGTSSLGGIVGTFNSYGNLMCILENCCVTDCEISGVGTSTGISAIIGYEAGATTSRIILKDLSVKNVRCTISNSGSGGVVVGRINGIQSVYSISGTNVENITLIGAGTTPLTNLYGFDAPSGYYVFHPYETGLNISEIQLTNGNSIKNLVIKNETCPVPTNTDMTFNGIANITGATLGESWSYIVADAFTGTGITTEVILPNMTGSTHVNWILLNGTSDTISSLSPSKFMYAVERKEAQEVTLNANGGTPCGKLFVNMNAVPLPAPLAQRAGYDFLGWYGETALTNMVFNDTGVVNKSVSGWTDADGKWIHDGAGTLYANWTVNTYTVHFDANGGQGSMDDMTFTYDQGQNLTANAFQRYNSNFLYWTYNGTKYYNTEFVQNLTTVDGDIVVMKAQWESYSTGGSSSGSTYMGSNSASYTPTQQPTVKPTVTPTATPTEQPATPTVIATAKPTTQATQQSPAPFLGILTGLGAAAVLLRLRK